MRITESLILQWVLVILGLRLNGVAAGPPSEIYSASFLAPAIELNRTASINYQVNLTTTEPSTVHLLIELCQTTSQTLLDISDTNSWQVLNALENFCLTNKSPDETCKNQPFEGRGIMHLNLTTDAAFNTSGSDTLNNFFFCFSNEASTSAKVCDYSSNLFNISPAIAGTKPVDPKTIDTFPASFPIPYPLSVSITTTKSSILLAQIAEPLTTEPAVPNTSTLLPNKQITTGSKIGIAFGILSLFLLLGFLALFFLRRSRIKKKVTASQSLTAKSFQHTEIHAEKANSGLPTTPLGWENSQTRNLIQSQAPEQGIEDKNFNCLLTSTPGLKGTGLSTPNKPRIEENAPVVSPAHVRRSLSVVSRESAGSLSISPIPSPQSLAFEHSKDGVASQARSDLGMSLGFTAPFLREEGMSAEDMARLEDEERRIDAAIAEAEAQRAQGRR